jgi:hypothetical protein
MPFRAIVLVAFAVSIVMAPRVSFAQTSMGCPM